MIAIRRSVVGDRPRSILALVAVLVSCATPLAISGEASLPSDPSGVTGAREVAGSRIGGRLLWVASGEVDLVGDLWADLPLVKLGAGTTFFHLDNRLAMRKPDTHFTFLVRDLEYGARLGWRARPHWARGREVSAFVARRGRERVDAPGAAFVSYPGLGLAGSRWAVHAGPVLSEQAVRGDLVVAGEARLPLVRGRGVLLGFDVEADALVDGGEWRAETAAGPRLEIPLGPGIAASLQLLYSRGRNPLGFEGDRWLLGFAYEKVSPASAPLPAGDAPDIDGRIAAGAGRGRGSGRLVLRFRSPDLLSSTHVLFAIDGNVLTARDTTDLYYRYRLGLERPLDDGILLTTDFYHRSNHQLAEPGDGVTSINVLEAGIETRGWMRPAASASGRALDATAHVGYLVDGSFGMERRWHVRGGVRWVPLASARLYLRAEGEAGDVENHSYAVGLGIRPALDLEAEYRSDDQYFSRDRRALLLTASYGF